MRQRLINKQASSEPAAGERSLKGATGNQLSLTDLLFSKFLSKSEWKAGLQAHSNRLTNLLLNGEHQAFERYMKAAASNLISLEKINGKDKKKGNFVVRESEIAQLDYKPLLQDLLQLAILIEHSTIPPYLTALYSIKEGTNAWMSQVIRSIAVEEMLHMIMVCNVMNAIDIQPRVNGPENFPAYPAMLPLNVDFYVGLDKCSKNTISTFIAIESPSSPLVVAPIDPQPAQERVLAEAVVREDAPSHWTFPNLEAYIKEHVATIGEFYDLVFFFVVIFQVLEYYKEHDKWPTSIKALNEGGIFTGDPKKQIQPDQYYGSGGILHAVTCLEDVFKVFEEIKGQGEGGDGTLYSIDPSQFGEGFEPAHYFRFKEIFHEHTYAGGDYTPFSNEAGMMPITTPPVGDELPVDWSAVYPIRPNLKIADLAGNPALAASAKAFNKTYKQLLDAIQEAIEGKQEELGKSILIMYALKEQAVSLMKQPLNAQENAAPTFEYPTN